MSIQKVRTGKQGKNFQKKEENENFPINFYLQVLVLVLTEMQSNYINIKTIHPFSLPCSSKFLSFHSCLFIFLFVFKQQTEQNLVVLLLYAEAGIESCSVKQLFGKI